MNRLRGRCTVCHLDNREVWAIDGTDELLCLRCLVCRVIEATDGAGLLRVTVRRVRGEAKR